MASSLGAEEVRRPVPTLKGVAEEEVDGDGVGVHGAAAAAVAVCISPPERRNYVRGGGPWLDSGRELE